MTSPEPRSHRESLRKRLIESQPRWYNPWVHLASTTGLPLIVLALTLYNVRELRPYELLVIPFIWMLSNAVEWRAHKSFLHRRLWPIQVLYDRHTPEHHVIYVPDDFSIREVKEFRLVLIPAMGVLLIIIGGGLFGMLAAQLISANAGWMVLITTSLYVLSYELLHLAYHLPPTHPIGGHRWIRFLREHHRIHHHPRLMQQWNFNVTVPFYDMIAGTIAPKSLVDQVMTTPSATASAPPQHLSA